MKIILPSLAILVLMAAALRAQTDSPTRIAGVPTDDRNPRFRLPEEPVPATLAPATATDGADLLVQRVAATLSQRQTVFSRVRFYLDLFGHETRGDGLYLQTGVGDDLRLRLELKTAVSQHSLTHVYDGQYLWQYHAAEQPASARPTISRVDVQRVRQALLEEKRDAAMTGVGELALGGLPKLLQGLRGSFRFTRAEAGKLDSLPVWIVTGSWRPEALKVVSKELASQAAQGQPLRIEKLPPHLPEEVVLFVGQDDLFPYRVEYRRRAAGQGRGSDSGGKTLPLVIVEFWDVSLNRPIASGEFVYNPSVAAQVLDTTATFLKSLGIKQ